MEKRKLTAYDRYKDYAYVKLHKQIERLIVNRWSREGECEDEKVEEVVSGKTKITYKVSQVMIKK